MRENRTSGSVQGAPGNRRSYCETWVSRLFSLLRDMGVQAFPGNRRSYCETWVSRLFPPAFLLRDMGVQAFPGFSLGQTQYPGG